MIGKPCVSPKATTSSTVATGPSEPGIEAIPAATAASFALILSPKISKWCVLGPTKMIPSSSQRSAKRKFSDKKP